MGPCDGIRARSLTPLVKARGFGMTPLKYRPDWYQVGLEATLLF
jgi:hypothetical protein